MTTVVTEPTAESLPFELAVMHLKVDPDTADSPPSYSEESLIKSLITAARQHCEQYTQLCLAEQTLEVAFDAFESSIGLPFGPVGEVVSVKYVSSTGAELTLASSTYKLSKRTTPASIYPDYGQAWPATRAQPEAVVVQYTAGYSADTLPKTIQAAMLLMVGHLYENREASVLVTNAMELPLGVRALLDPYRESLGV
jgi:uncharacterized phiE125 gp8 family phage protein